MFNFNEVKEFGNVLGVEELKETILTKIVEEDLVFAYTCNHDKEVFEKVLEVLETEGFISKKELIGGLDCVALYKEVDKTLIGYIQLMTKQDYFSDIYDTLENLKLEKIEEVERLNNELQEIVRVGKVVTYPKKLSLKPIRLNVRKGDIKEAFTILCKVMRLVYQIKIEIPKQQKRCII